MCTVSYIPTEDGFLLTSNRDENPERPRSIPPQKFEHKNQALFYPKDALAGGTWIVTSEKDYTLCLLNGAFEKHKHEPPYKKSRGLVVLEFYNYDTKNDFVKDYDFRGIEPFTLLIIRFNGDKELTELRWNGETLFVNDKDVTKAHIWSSSTLYETSIIKKREILFAEFLNENTLVNQEQIIGFHSEKDETDPYNSFMMNRSKNMRTVSTTSIFRTQEYIKMVYHDIISEKTYRYRIMQMNSTCEKFEE